MKNSLKLAKNFRPFLVLVTIISVTFFITSAIVIAAEWIGPTEPPPAGNLPGFIYNVDGLDNVTQTKAEIKIDGPATVADLMVNSDATIGAILNAGSVRAPKICLIDDQNEPCRTTWPGGGGEPGLWSLNPNLIDIFYNLGKVGIGTDSPNRQLHIKTASGNAEIDIQSGDSIHWGIYNDEATKELRFWNGNDRVVFSNNGNVGIGTTQPNFPLHVKGNLLVEYGNPSFDEFDPNGSGGVGVMVGDLGADSAAILASADKGSGVGVKTFGGGFGFHGTNYVDVFPNGEVLAGVYAWNKDDVENSLAGFFRGSVVVSNGDLDINGKTTADEFCLVDDCITEWPTSDPGGESFWSKVGVTDNIYYNLGKVGIGIDNPEVDLDVAGAIKSDSYIMAGEVPIPPEVNPAGSIVAERDIYVGNQATIGENVSALPDIANLAEGNISVDSITIRDSSQDIVLTHVDGDLALHGLGLDNKFKVGIASGSGDGEHEVGISILGRGGLLSQEPLEQLKLGWYPGQPDNINDGEYVITVAADDNGGITRPISIYTQDKRGQLYLDTDGDVGVGTDNPENTLHIYRNNGNQVNAEIKIQSSTDNSWGIYHDRTSDDLRFWNGLDTLGSNILTLTKNGGLELNDSIADGDASVALGRGNQIKSSGTYSAIGGGRKNMASGHSNVIGGGFNNETSGTHSVVAGGLANKALGDRSAILGGTANTVSGSHGTVGGGGNNEVSGLSAVIAGGENNIASGYFSTILGGEQNVAGGEYSFAAGRNMQLQDNASQTFIWGHSDEPVSVGTPDSFIVYSGNVGIGTTNTNAKFTVRQNDTNRNFSFGNNFIMLDGGSMAGAEGQNKYIDFNAGIVFRGNGPAWATRFTTAPNAGFWDRGEVVGIYKSETNPADALNFNASSSEFIANNIIAVFRNDGKVGIGTYNPSAELDVNGSATVRDNLNVYGDLNVAGTIYGASKSFVQDHPTDPTKQIIYTSLEGGEAGTYTRGSGQLINGQAVIDLPEHFSLVTNNEGITVQLTLTSDTTGLYVASKGNKQIVVKQINDGQGNATFDYLVQGVRIGYEDRAVIVEKGQNFAKVTPEQESETITPEEESEPVADVQPQPSKKEPKKKWYENVGDFFSGLFK